MAWIETTLSLKILDRFLQTKNPLVCVFVLARKGQEDRWRHLRLAVFELGLCLSEEQQYADTVTMQLAHISGLFATIQGAAFIYSGR